MKILFLTHTTDSTMGGWGRYTHDLMQVLSHEDIEVRSIEMAGVSKDPLSYLSNPFLLLIDALKVRRMLAEYQPDIIHITVEPYLLFLPFLSLTSQKVVLTVHGSYAYLPVFAPPLFQGLYRSLYARALVHIDQVIAVSEYTKEYLLRCLEQNHISYGGDKVEVIHNGIEVQKYTYQNERMGNGPKRILTVAPVKSRKGLLESIRAVGVYRERYGSEAEYRIVGGYDPKSNLAKELYDETMRLDIADVVTFVGRVSDEELKKEYEQADLFLMLPIVKMPYFEGFGLVYLEANACGVPTVGSREGGSVEAIQDGVSGFIVDANDPELVAGRIHDVLDKGLISRERARAWAEEHNVSQLVERIQGLYDKLLL